MLKINKTVNLNGTVTIEVDGIVKNVAYCNANIPEDGRISINKNINDKELFEANKETVLKDFSEFEKIAYGVIEK